MGAEESKNNLKRTEVKAYLPARTQSLTATTNKK